MRFLRASWRALRVIEHLLTGTLISLYASVISRPGQRPAWVPRATAWWHGRLCRALGVRLEVTGGPLRHCLLVANHVSWLDIPVLGAQGEMGFLSKAEVRSWPLVGWMAGLVGTLFIARGANQVAAVAQQISAELDAGRVLVIFPEGTTSDGRQVRRFHPRLFAVAQRPGIGVQPVAISYHRGDDSDPDPTAPFVGDDTLLANLMRVLIHPGLRVRVHFLPVLLPGAEEDRRRLAERTRAAIQGALGLADEVAVAVGFPRRVLSPALAEAGWKTLPEDR